MSQVSLQPSRFLVVVQSRGTTAETIEYALREARDLHAEYEHPVTVDVRIVFTDAGTDSETSAQIGEAISAFDLSDEIQTSVEGLSLTGSDPESRVESLLGLIDADDVSRLIVAADTELSVARLRDGFGVTVVELAPRSTAQDRRRLLHPGGVRRLGTIFGLTYLFYLAIGGFAGGLDLVTGAISAGVVALSLSHVSLGEEPELRRTGGRVARMLAFLPVLLWEVVKANFVIAYIILHPKLPIDPAIEVVDTDTREGIERMVLANSITLTPGTLTVDVRGRAFTVHSLTAQARSDLSKGRLQRLVSWVFQRSAETETGARERGVEQ